MIDCQSFRQLARHVRLTESSKAPTKVCAQQQAVLSNQGLW